MDLYFPFILAVIGAACVTLAFYVITDNWLSD